VPAFLAAFDTLDEHQPITVFEYKSGRFKRKAVLPAVGLALAFIPLEFHHQRAYMSI